MKNEKTQLSIVQNTGKYRTAAKIQEFTGFTGPLGSLMVEIKTVVVTAVPTVCFKHKPY